MDTPWLSFGWPLQDGTMIEGEDGLFYDVDGVRYHRIGETRHYRYEDVSSIFEGKPSPMMDVVVTRALEYSDPETLQKFRHNLNNIN
jgi:hypothetical protein